MTTKEVRDIARQFIQWATKAQWNLETVENFLPKEYRLSKDATVEDFSRLTMHEVSRAYQRFIRKA